MQWWWLLWMDVQKKLNGVESLLFSSFWIGSRPRPLWGARDRMTSVVREEEVGGGERVDREWRGEGMNNNRQFVVVRWRWRRRWQQQPQRWCENPTLSVSSPLAANTQRNSSSWSSPGLYRISTSLTSFPLSAPSSPSDKERNKDTHTHKTPIVVLLKWRPLS